MSPANHLLEVVQQVVFAPLARVVAVVYVLLWDSLVAGEVKKEEAAVREKEALGGMHTRSSDAKKQK